MGVVNGWSDRHGCSDSIISEDISYGNQSMTDGLCPIMQDFKLSKSCIILENNPRSTIYELFRGLVVIKLHAKHGGSGSIISEDITRKPKCDTQTDKAKPICLPLTGVGGET